MIIIQHFISEKWLTWETLENLLATFPYRGRDSNSKPVVQKSKKMKVKSSRKIIGCFAEISTLIRSFPQLFYNNIKDHSDPYWIWLIKIREFLRYMQMPQISDNQIEKMELTLDTLMNMRLDLTRKSDTVAADIDKKCSTDESDSDESDSDWDDEMSKDSKYDPPVTFKGIFF